MVPATVGSHLRQEARLRAQSSSVEMAKAPIPEEKDGGAAEQPGGQEEPTPASLARRKEPTEGHGGQHAEDPGDLQLPQPGIVANLRRRNAKPFVQPPPDSPCGQNQGRQGNRSPELIRVGLPDGALDEEQQAEQHQVVAEPGQAEGHLG